MKLSGIDNSMEFDFGKTSREYAKYRDIYPIKLYEELYELGVGLKNQDWLDLGTGTGVIPRGMYKYGANIVGTDISENQIAEAVSLSRKNDMDIAYKVCPAEDTGFSDDSFDVITACQCFWYFDKSLIVPEIKRLLRRNGMFVKIYMTWLDEDPIASKSQALVKSMNPDWMSGASAIEDLSIHCFDNHTMKTLCVDLPFTKDTWNGRVNACRGVLGSMSREVFEEFSIEHKKLMEDLEDEFIIKHKIYINTYRI